MMSPLSVGSTNIFNSRNNKNDKYNNNSNDYDNNNDQYGQNNDNNNINRIRYDSYIIKENGQLLQSRINQNIMAPYQNFRQMISTKMRKVFVLIKKISDCRNWQKH